MDFDKNLYSHYSFDLWLTLIKSHKDFKIKRSQLLQNVFSIERSLVEVSEAIRKYDLIANIISEKSGYHIHSEAIVLLILNSLHYDMDNITSVKLSDFQTESENLFFKFRPLLIDPKIGHLLNELTNRGKTISILSNTAFINGKMLRKILDYYEVGDFFSFQIYSDEVGLSKPNTRLFDLVNNEVQKINPVERKNILHIGDNIIADYKGALNAGFSAFLYK